MSMTVPSLEATKTRVDKLGLKLRGFDRELTAEAVFWLVEHAGRSLSLLDVLAMMGLADHIQISKCGLPISGDDYVADAIGMIPVSLFMDLWSVLSAGGHWRERARLEGAKLEIEGSTRWKRLSRADKAALDEAFDCLFGAPADEVVELLNERCPAWLQNLGQFVPLQSVFMGFGATVDEAKEQVLLVDHHLEQANRSAA